MFLEKPPVALNAIKKSRFSGSQKGLRYLLHKEEDLLVAYVYPDVFCFEATKEEEKEKKTFPFGEDGYKDCIKWLNEIEENQSEKWKSIREKSFIERVKM